MVKTLIGWLERTGVVVAGLGLLTQLDPVYAQAPEPPPTSGGLVTIILGLMASSLVVVLVGVWTVRGIVSLRKRMSAQGLAEPGANGSSGRFCTQCGEPMSVEDGFCHFCGAKVKELAQ